MQGQTRRVGRQDPKPPLALITNDDGIGSEGLRQLALAAVGSGLRVVVAAPMTESSGASASLTAAEADGRLVIEHRTLPDLHGRSIYAVGGLPAYIALVAARGAFGDVPDVVLSGINNGPNTGHAILHSGTVGAALTAAGQGISSLAVSLAIGTERHWEAGSAYASRVLPALLQSPPGTALNLNVPNLGLEGIRGSARRRWPASVRCRPTSSRPVRVTCRSASPRSTRAPSRTPTPRCWPRGGPR